MRYLSTRGGVTPIGFGDAVMMGLATDGGLLVPETIPQIDDATWSRWAGLSFAELAVEVMLPYVEPDLSRAELTELVQASYRSFDHPEVAPLVEAGGLPILELFHGPTAAFKDVALQFLGNLFEFLLERRGGRLNILGATSGDTGSAAIAGVRGKDRIHIFILHPKGRVSPIQERQMTTILDANVHNIAIRGTFDDGQRIVKALFRDLEFKASHQLGAINSINWTRVLAQIVYFVYAWGRVSGGDTRHRVSFSVPTGNFGDVFAGYMAKRMGLPVDRLVVATNRNDILTRFMQTGRYAVSSVHPSISPSMDIQVASNFERYLFELFGRDPAAVRTAMQQLADAGGFSVTPAQLSAAQADFDAAAVDDDSTLAQIRDTHAASGYVLDPHTAIGVRAAAQPGTVCLATAHPAKFPAAVEQAIGEQAAPPRSLQGVLEGETRCVELDADEAAIKAFMQQTLQNAATPS